MAPTTTRRTAASSNNGASKNFEATAIAVIKSRESTYQDAALNLRASILDTAKSLGSMPISNEAKKEALESMAKTMDEALEVKFTIDDFLAALGNWGSSDSTSDDSLVKIYDDRITAEMTRRARQIGSRVEKDTQHKRFASVSASILGTSEVDDDCQVDETQDATEASLRDHFTQKLFENPMRSNKCGHVYSKSIVETYFATSKICIHPGCNKRLQVADFERDAETELALKRFKQKTSVQQECRGEVDDEADNSL